MNLKKILKGILITAKDIAIDNAERLIPGAPLVILAIEKLTDKDNTNNADAIGDMGEGIITALKSLKGDEVKDPVALNVGINDAEAAFLKIKNAIR